LLRIVDVAAVPPPHGAVLLVHDDRVLFLQVLQLSLQVFLVDLHLQLLVLQALVLAQLDSGRRVPAHRVAEILAQLEGLLGVDFGDRDGDRLLLDLLQQLLDALADDPLGGFPQQDVAELAHEHAGRHLALAEAVDAGVLAVLRQHRIVLLLDRLLGDLDAHLDGGVFQKLHLFALQHRHRVLLVHAAK